MRAAKAAIAALVLVAWPTCACAQSELIGAEAFDLGLDLRASVTGGETGWLDGGFGKLREGGNGGDAVPRAEVASADLAWKPQIGWNFSGLKAIGVRIALDDFGTGFSSLSDLRRFPFDKIKIDRSFILELLREREASAVVKAITDLAAALNMETTAEGVEEFEQVEALRAYGCTNVQGYLFSEPVPASEVRPLLAVEMGRRAA